MKFATTPATKPTPIFAETAKTLNAMADAMGKVSDWTKPSAERENVFELQSQATTQARAGLKELQAFTKGLPKNSAAFEEIDDFMFTRGSVLDYVAGDFGTHPPANFFILRNLSHAGSAASATGLAHAIKGTQIETLQQIDALVAKAQASQ